MSQALRRFPVTTPSCQRLKERSAPIPPGSSSSNMRIALNSLLAVALLTSFSDATAQSLLDHSPDVSGDWTGAPGTIYFHFLHRFTASGAPERKVSNVPTFLL